MMHIVGSNPKSPKRSNHKTILEDLSGDIQEDSNETSMVTIEVPAQSPTESPIHMTALNIVSVQVTPASSAETVANITDHSATDIIHAINLAPAQRPTPLTTYTVDSSNRYLQPYPLISTSPTPTIRHRVTPKLPWLECSGGLAAFTIISGVIAIDGMKQSPTEPPPTAQQTQPTIARLPNNPTSIPQVSTSELLNTGRTLPVPTGAMNFPQQVAMNPSLESPSTQGLNSGTAEMNSIVVQKDLGTLPTTTTQALPKPLLQKTIAPPEKLTQEPVRTIPQPIQQPIPQPVLPVQPAIQQSSPVSSNDPVFTPQAVQPEPSQAMPPDKSQDPQFLEVPPAPTQPASTTLPPLQNDPNTSPTTLKPIRSSAIVPSADVTAPLSDRTPIILEANPQSAISTTNSNDALRLEVSKL